MIANVGSTDRLIRIILGIALIAWSFMLLPPMKYVALAAGVIALLTGVFRFCGLYKLLGINTCKVR